MQRTYFLNKNICIFKNAQLYILTDLCYFIAPLIACVVLSFLTTYVIKTFFIKNANINNLHTFSITVVISRSIVMKSGSFSSNKGDFSCSNYFKITSKFWKLAKGLLIVKR